MAHLLLEDAMISHLGSMSPKTRARFTANTRVATYPFKVESLINSAITAAYSRVSFNTVTGKHDDLYATIKIFVATISELIKNGHILDWPKVSSAVSNALGALRSARSAELAKYVKVLTGSNNIFPHDESWWIDIERALRQELETRLAGNLADYTDKISSYVMKSVSEKVPESDIVAGIQDMEESISTTRARFLARDLSGTINSLSTQKMHTQVLGINTYMWVTAADERVRGTPGGPYASAVPSHYIMERVLCRWDNPNVYSVDGGEHWDPKTPLMPHSQAGMAYQCRCVPEAYLGGVVTATKARFARNK